jgi:hypothetical protein
MIRGEIDSGWKTLCRYCRELLLVKRNVHGKLRADRGSSRSRHRRFPLQSRLNRRVCKSKGVGGHPRPRPNDGSSLVNRHGEQSYAVAQTRLTGLRWKLRPGKLNPLKLRRIERTASGEQGSLSVDSRIGQFDATTDLGPARDAAQCLGDRRRDVPRRILGSGTGSLRDPLKFRQDMRFQCGSILHRNSLIELGHSRFELRLRCRPLGA